MGRGKTVDALTIHSPSVTSNLALHQKSLHHCQSTDGRHSQLKTAPNSFVSRILPLSLLEDVFCGHLFPDPAPSRTFKGTGGWGAHPKMRNSPQMANAAHRSHQILFRAEIHSRFVPREAVTLARLSHVTSSPSRQAQRSFHAPESPPQSREPAPAPAVHH